jgi:hypothetical protein
MCVCVSVCARVFDKQWMALRVGKCVFYLDNRA